MKKPLGIILYKGPSQFDGKNIIVIATGLFGKKSKNPKIGDMIPIWILRRDIPPVLAAKIFEDFSICGDCKHRDFHSCYVSIHHGPYNVYDALHRDRYLDMAGDPAAYLPHFAGKNLRFGAYGDPAAIPTEVWAKLALAARMYTGYTHAWKTCDDRLKNYCMASCDTEKEKHKACSMGWRTFRVKLESDNYIPDEMTCPASNEAGKLMDCGRCGMCEGVRTRNDGSMVRSIVIQPHGGGAYGWRKKNFEIGIKKLRNKKKWRRDLTEIRELLNIRR